MLRRLEDDQGNLIGNMTDDTAGWAPYQKAPAAPETIERWLTKWPGCNLGIITGAISGIVVLDVDSRHGGDESLAKVPPLPPGPVVKTPNGRHFYFRHPGQGVRIRNRWGKQDKPLPGLDIRGDGGYVVGPGSVVGGIMYTDMAEAGDDVA